MFVPVVDRNQNPLMPTSSSRARRWIKSGKGTPFWKKGVFCIRLNIDPSFRNMQSIVVGIDPGSKKEGYTVKSQAHTYLNIQADAVTWVKHVIKVRRQMRRGRRYRKTPCRANRKNRSIGGIPPSTRARWGWKLRICNWLIKMFPIDQFIVEDIKAKTRGQRKWDRVFSPLEVGKKWFYGELSKIAIVKLKRGYETKKLRDELGLRKIKQKMANVFEAHCIDSWVLANFITGGHVSPDNKDILTITPLRFHRRQLHRFQPMKNGIRRVYGGTNSLGFKRGSLIRHSKWGLIYVGGFLKNRISLHSLTTGKRLTQRCQPTECKFLTFNSWRFSII